MSQMTWTYVDDYGASHDVGLFHGMNTGHLMIYCNTRIMFIDFNVTSKKKYSFFINDELCDIEIEEKDGKFAYGFEIDQKTQTQRNLNRKKQERKDLINSILLIMLIMGMIAGAVVLFI